MSLISKISIMQAFNIKVGSLIKFTGENTLYEVYSIRPDGKYYFWNIQDTSDQYTGHTSEFTGIVLL
jgi:hypothetical protein